MSPIIRNSIRFLLFIAVQVVILNEVPPLHRFIVPYLYFLFILWLPFKINRLFLLFLAFCFGLSMDYFAGTPGLHAAPCVLIAYLRPFLLNLLIAQDSKEQSYVEPSLKSMGWAPYGVYVAILTFIHHCYLVLIEWLSFGDFWYFLGKTAATTGISLLLILITELLFYRKGKYRTNTA